MANVSTAHAFQSPLTRQSAGGNLGATAADDVFWQIWQWITEDRASSGARVAETSLADRFQVSRTPLRDAIQRLVSIGLIQRRMNRTLVVTPLSIADMEAISRTREAIEGMIAAQVTERFKAGEIDLAPLEQLNDRMRRLAEIEEIDLLLDTGRAFHDEMLRLSDNAHATRILSQLMMCLERYRRLVLDETSRSTSIVDEHDKLLAAIRNKDGEAAERLMRQHIADARAFYRKVLPRILAEDPSSSHLNETRAHIREA